MKRLGTKLGTMLLAMSFLAGTFASIGFAQTAKPGAKHHRKHRHGKKKRLASKH